MNSGSSGLIKATGWSSPPRNTRVPPGTGWNRKVRSNERPSTRAPIPWRGPVNSTWVRSAWSGSKSVIVATRGWKFDGSGGVSSVCRWESYVPSNRVPSPIGPSDTRRPSITVVCHLTSFVTSDTNSNTSWMSRAMSIDSSGIATPPFLVSLNQPRVRLERRTQRRRQAPLEGRGVSSM